MLHALAALSLALLIAPPTNDAPAPATPAFPRPIAGLAAAASAELDAFGIPVVHAASFADALRAQGYLHARDRFAQMDLLRRLTAGELCEIAGALAIGQDEQQRVLRLRSVAERAYQALDPKERTLLDAYTEGVNAGIADLTSPPPEHAFLRAPLAPWRPEDSLLIGLGMSAMLNDSAQIERSWAEVDALVPAPVIAFFVPRVSRWDTPLIADTPEARAAAASPIPDASVVDTRRLRAAIERERAAGAGAPSGRSDAGTTQRFSLAAWLPDAPEDGPLPIGSNGWAVSGRRTKDGRAILVNDMHLALTVPGIWYRMSFRYEEDGAQSLDGITLPGAPGLVSGSNGHVAWGFTNVEGDFMDFAVVEPDPADPSKYLVPGGSEAYTIERETIRIANAEPKTIEVRLTRWGPIVGTDASKRPLALVWAATQPHGLNLDLLRFRAARTVTEALAVAAAWRGPQQNVVVADRDGHIGWTISGYLPERRAMDGTVPVSWADGRRGWSGEMPESSRPRVIDPEEGIIATANQRTMRLDAADRFGRMWAPPDRAYRIRERALADAPLDERACSAVQLDVRSVRLIAWRDRILPALEADSAKAAGSDAPDAAAPANGTPSRSDGDRAKRCASLAKLLRAWDGNVTADSKAVAIIDRTRGRVTNLIAKAMVESSILDRQPERSPKERSELAARLVRGWPEDERALDVLDARPDHLLPPVADSWDQLLQDVALAIASEIRTKEGLPTWGTVNACSIAHPLARALPVLASTFSLPTHEQPGHWSTVRVATPSFGASDRLVVSPGREGDGSLTTPAGQSARPTSPHYGDLHAAWRDGVFAPLLPGAMRERIEFAPATAAPKPAADAGQPTSATPAGTGSAPAAR